MTPRLSICIPTYNRAQFLAETLASVADQIDPRVEVVVSDNASTDDTREVVERFREALPQLVYWRSATNRGFSPNFMRAVELGTGEYRWLLGSDDLIAPGMIERLLADLDSGETVYVYDRIEWDAQADTRRPDPVLMPAAPERYALSDPAALLTYLDAGHGLTALLSFISSVVFRADAWFRVPFPERWHSCAFPHALRLFTALVEGGTLRYVREPLVWSRLGNDTFNPGGSRTIKRLMMDYDGLRMLIDELWSGNQAAADAARAVVRRTHHPSGVLKFRRIVRSDELAPLCANLAYFGYGRVYTAFYRTEVSRHAVLGLKALYRQLGWST